MKTTYPKTALEASEKVSLTLNIHEKNQFQICFLNISDVYSYALLVRFNDVVFNKEECTNTINEMEFCIVSYTNINLENEVAFVSPFIVKSDGNCDLASNAINFDFYVKEMESIDVVNQNYIYNVPFTLGKNQSLHFTNFMNNTAAHIGGLCPGVKNCKLQI